VNSGGWVAKTLTLNFRVADSSWFSKGRGFEFSVFLPFISQDRRESSHSCVSRRRRNCSTPINYRWCYYSREIRREWKALRAVAFMSELKLRPPKRRYAARMVAGIQKQERSLVASLCRDDNERRQRKATVTATAKGDAKDGCEGRLRRQR